MTLECPVCGSNRLVEESSLRSAQALFGASVTYKTSLHRCEECGEVGDFSGATDKALEAALVTSEKSSVEPMIERLHAAGISMAYLERSLGLPARTSARWKSGELSAAPLALLRLVSTFPWLVHVAESGFDAGIAAQHILEQAALVLKNSMKRELVTATMKTVTVFDLRARRRRATPRRQAR